METTARRRQGHQRPVRRMTWLTDIQADIASGKQAVIDDWPPPEIAASVRFEDDARKLAERYRFNPVTLAHEGDRRCFGSLAVNELHLVPLYRRAYLIAVAHRAHGGT